MGRKKVIKFNELVIEVLKLLPKHERPLIKQLEIPKFTRWDTYDYYGKIKDQRKHYSKLKEK